MKSAIKSGALTRLRKMCLGRSVLSSPPVAYKVALLPVERNSLKNLRMRKNLAKWVPHRFCKAFAAFTLSATCDLAIGDLGVDAIESLDVGVASNFVKMMKRKKVARNRSSNFDSSISILLAMLHRVVLASFSRSSEERNSVVLVLVEDLREFSLWVHSLFLLSLVQLDHPSSWHTNVMVRGFPENCYTFHPLAT